MTAEPMKMIPLSVIDAKIKELKSAMIAGPTAFITKDGVEWNKMLRDTEIKILERIKKEAIPIPTQSTIPMSVIDALILKLEKQQKEMGATLQRLYKIEILEEIKKEAIVPNPSELEQRIRDRIKELEKLNHQTLGEWAIYKAIIDELRKLLS